MGMSVLAAEVALFSKLPPELREEIWSLCLPLRVCEMDCPINGIEFDDGDNNDGPWPFELVQTTRANKHPLLISRVCRESRALAFKNGSILDVVDIGGPYTESENREIWAHLDLESVWRDTRRDMIHRNWTSANDAWQGHRTQLSPLPRLVREVSTVTHSSSLMLDSLGDLLTGFLAKRSSLPGDHLSLLSTPRNSKSSWH